MRMEILTNVQRNVNRAVIEFAKTNKALGQLFEASAVSEAIDLMVENQQEYLDAVPDHDLTKQVIAEAISADMVKAVFPYFKKSDSLEVLGIEQQGGAITIKVKVKYGGSDFNINSIPAPTKTNPLQRSFNVITDLPRNESDDIEAFIRKVQRFEKAKDDLMTTRNDYTFYEGEYFTAMRTGDDHKLKLSTVRMTDLEKTITKNVNKIKSLLKEKV